MNDSPREQTFYEVVVGIPRPLTKNGGVTLSNLPSKLRKKYTSPKPLFRPPPRIKANKPKEDEEKK